MSEPFLIPADVLLRHLDEAINHDTQAVMRGDSSHERYLQITAAVQANQKMQRVIYDMITKMQED